MDKKNTTETIDITRDKNTFPSQETSQGHAGVQYTAVYLIMWWLWQNNSF